MFLKSNSKGISNIVQRAFHVLLFHKISQSNREYNQNNTTGGTKKSVRKHLLSFSTFTTSFSSSSSTFITIQRLRLLSITSLGGAQFMYLQYLPPHTLFFGCNLLSQWKRFMARGFDISHQKQKFSCEFTLFSLFIYFSFMFHPLLLLLSLLVFSSMTYYIIFTIRFPLASPFVCPMEYPFLWFVCSALILN